MAGSFHVSVRPRGRAMRVTGVFHPFSFRYEKHDPGSNPGADREEGAVRTIPLLFRLSTEFTIGIMEKKV